MGAEDFVKLSVRYRADMALAGVSDDAELTFLRALAYCGLNATGGLVPTAELPNIAPRRRVRVADELVAAGFWEPMPNGWAFASWEKWQGDLEQVEDKRRRDAERKRQWRREQRAGRPADETEGAA